VNVEENTSTAFALALSSNERVNNCKILPKLNIFANSSNSRTCPERRSVEPFMDSHVQLADDSKGVNDCCMAVSTFRAKCPAWLRRYY
jgi:hypothetical protein